MSDDATIYGYFPDRFREQFTGLESFREHRETVSYVSQDAAYSLPLPDPGWQTKSKSWVKENAADPNAMRTVVHLHQEHGNGWIDTEIAFDMRGGEPIGLSIETEAGKPVRVPDWAKSAADGTVKLAGTMLIPFTGGESKAVAKKVVRLIDMMCFTINTASRMLFWLSDDGGRLNFPAVAAHNLNRIANAMGSREVGGPLPLPEGLGFDYKGFPARLKQAHFFKDEPDARYDSDGWSARDPRCTPLLAVRTSVRIWRPDISVCPGNLAALVSAKIDLLSAPKDNHAVVVAVVNSEGHLLCVQVGLENTNLQRFAWTPAVAAKVAEGRMPDAESDRELRERAASQIFETADDNFRRAMLFFSDVVREFLRAVPDSIIVR